jgi:hypothetical protein
MEGAGMERLDTGLLQTHKAGRTIKTPKAARKIVFKRIKVSSSIEKFELSYPLGEHLTRNLERISDLPHPAIPGVR